MVFSSCRIKAPLKNLVELRFNLLIKINSKNGIDFFYKVDDLMVSISNEDLGEILGEFFQKEEFISSFYFVKIIKYLKILVYFRNYHFVRSFFVAFSCLLKPNV